MAVTHGRLTAKETASYLGVSCRTLQDWRTRQVGPAFYRVGKRIEYALADVKEFRDGNYVQPKKDGDAK